jgi:hypothetical protein
MTDKEKQAECERICGPNVKPDMHRTAPVLFPFARDRWLGLTKRKELWK